MIAMMLTYQPFLMGGIDDHKASTSNAYGAMAMFLFTFVVSVVYLIQDRLTSVTGNMSYSPRCRSVFSAGQKRQLLQYIMLYLAKIPRGRWLTWLYGHITSKNGPGSFV